MNILFSEQLKMNISENIGTVIAIMLHDLTGPNITTILFSTDSIGLSRAIEINLWQPFL